MSTFLRKTICGICGKPLGFILRRIQGDGYSIDVCRECGEKIDRQKAADKS